LTGSGRTEDFSALPELFYTRKCHVWHIIVNNIQNGSWIFVDEFE